jgi:hypothetical protein
LIVLAQNFAQITGHLQHRADRTLNSGLGLVLHDLSQQALNLLEQY